MQVLQQHLKELFYTRKVKNTVWTEPKIRIHFLCWLPAVKTDLELKYLFSDHVQKDAEFEFGSMHCATMLHYVCMHAFVYAMILCECLNVYVPVCKFLKIGWVS